MRGMDSGESRNVMMESANGTLPRVTASAAGTPIRPPTTAVAMASSTETMKLSMNGS